MAALLVSSAEETGAAVAIHPVVIDVHLPAGVAGPDPMDFDVRCFVVAHASGISLVDTGMPGSTSAIAEVLTSLGASWSDITDVLLSHDHPDHIGSLDDVRAHAPQAVVWGNAPVTARPLNEGDVVRDLTVIATPGHTAGHVSLLHGSGALLVGDIVGNQNGSLSRAPAPFTADAVEAERSLRKVAGIGFDRLLTGHGAELPDGTNALRELVKS
jgi:glyoxylase-like metal-dependent hydrolase (beta-lactamase superfamily II)